MSITDIISGKLITDSREERVTQKLARWLLTLGYSKSQIQTHPQYHIPRLGSSRKTLAVDLAIFKDDSRELKNLILIAECKQQDKSSGLDQLNLYLRAAGTNVGIWFNGTDIVYVINSPGIFPSLDDHPVINQPSNTEFGPKFGEHIRSRREARYASGQKKFSMRQVAARAGISPAYLSQLERGLYPPPTDEVISSIAKALDEDEDELMFQAGKLTTDVYNTIFLRSRVLIPLIKSLKDAPDETLLKIIDAAKQVRDGDW